MFRERDSNRFSSFGRDVQLDQFENRFSGGGMRFVFRISIWMALVFCTRISAFAFPDYLDAFRNDPFRSPTVDGCITCHRSPEGGDERNEFGSAFESLGQVITPVLRARFPDRFIYPSSKVTDTLIIHFSDPANKRVVVQTDSRYTLVDVEKRAIDGREVAGGSVANTPGPAAQPSAIPPSDRSAPLQAETKSSDSPDVNLGLDAYSHEGAFFGMSVVNLPNGKPLNAGEADFWIGHRFLQPICLGGKDKCTGGGPSDFFGLDSSALVAYGVKVGVKDRISVSAFRSNLFKTVEFSGAAQITRQSESLPVTIQVRGGVEGRKNFHERYSSFFQLVTVRTFMDRISFVVAPTFAFDTRNEATFVPPEFVFGAEHNHTSALGLGVGIRFRPSVSLVGEFIPRLHGFRGEFKDRPGVSIGLQKGTYRHTFELVISRQEPMTTAQYAVQGTDAFRIGFNIFRRVR